METLPLAAGDPLPKEAASGLWIDRREEAQRIVAFLLRASSPVVLLYGRHGTGKTELIRNLALHLLPPDLPAFYGDCAGTLPDHVRSAAGDEVELQAAASRPGVVFLDSFETVLDLPPAERERQFQRLCPSADLRCTTAVIFNEDRLGRAFGLRAYLPSILQAAMEIRPIGSERDAGELHLSLSGSSLDYEPAVLEVIASEAERMGTRTGSLTPSLLRAVDGQFRRYLDGTSGGKVSLKDYQARGGLWKILRDYLRGHLDALGQDGVLALALLDELAVAARTGAAPNLADLCLRTDASDADCRRLSSQLQEAGLLLPLEGGRWELTPQELAAVVESEVAETTEPSRRLLRQGLEAWREVGGLLPAENFAVVHRQGSLLRPGREGVEFLVRCAMLHAGGTGLEAAAHWLRRLESPQARIELLLPMLADSDPAVRRQAAAVLAGFDELEVRHHLHMVALRDTSEEVRQQAISSLRGMRSDDLLEFLLQEVSDVHSPYRAAAVETLRIFPHARAVEALHCIVKDEESPQPLCRLAIGVLAGFESSEAAQALVDIARHAAPEDRETTLKEVGASTSPALLANVLTIEREQALQQDRWWGSGRFGPLRAAGRLAGSLVLAALNGLVHGLLLLRLRRWRAAVALLTLEVLAVAVLVVWYHAPQGLGELLPLGLALWGLSWLISYLAPLAILLRQRRERLPEPGSIERTLAAVLYVGDALFPAFLVHGVLHAAAGRRKRALAIFATELASLALLYVVTTLPQIFYLPATGLEKPLFYETPWLIYLCVGLAMLVGSWLYDLAGTVGDLVLVGRDALSERLMANPLAAGIVLDLVTSPELTVAGWARGLVRRLGASMPPDLVLERLARADRGSRRLLVPGLIAKRGEAVELLETRWPAADPRMRGWIVSFLARRPTELSLAALARLRPRPLLRQRLRTVLAVWHWRIRIWPKTLLVTALLLAPIMMLLVYEGWMTQRNQAWPTIQVLQNENEPKPEVRVAAAEFLAKGYPKEGFDSLLQTLDGTHNAQVRLGIVDSLVTAAADPEYLARVLNELSSRLASGKNSVEVRQRILAGLRRIAGDNPGAVATGRPTPVLLTVLRDPREDLSFKQSALDVLQVAGAARPIEDFVAGSLASRTSLGGFQDLDLTARGRAAADEAKLRLDAVNALGRMGTYPAYLALLRLRKSEVRMPTELREQVMQELQDPLRRLKEDLDAERFEAVLRDGPRFLEAEEPGISRFEVLLLLARASQGLAAHLPATETWHIAKLGQDAIQYLDEASHLKDLPPDARQLLAEALIAEGNRLSATEGQEKLARERWSRALEVDPTLPESRRALLLLETERPEQAETLALTAVEKDPRDYLAYETLRRSLLQRGEALQAERIFRRLAEEKPQEILPRLNLAIVYHEQLSGENPEAFAKAYEEIAGLVSQERAAGQEPAVALLANFAELSLTTGRYRQAEKTARDLLEGNRILEPAMALNLELLAYTALALDGRLPEAAQRLSSLKQRYDHLGADFANGWSFAGLRTYLQRDAQLPMQRRQALLALTGLIQTPKLDSAEASNVFQENRAALDTLSK